ncbi:MAG: archaetidylserine decarboxylase [Parachlamydiaceae bacterium]
MEPIFYIDRVTGKICQEQVYGAAFLRLLYGKGLASRVFGVPLAHLLARIPWFSAFYGWMQNRKSSAKKVGPFIKLFGVDTSEFVKNPSEFVSFNDFFTRHLKPAARPIDASAATAIIPADGRYLFYQNIAECDGFVVKGEKFDLATLLQDSQLAREYAEGAMVIARLCPTDYHRYHFPCDCIPSKTQLINGWLYSVNPAAIKKNVHIFTENKRTLCTLDTAQFGKVLFLEIGATCVGAIHETCIPRMPYAKGDEKGYFSFGASSLILLFPAHSIRFDQDLLEASAKHIEIKCLMGQPMGTCV